MTDRKIEDYLEDIITAIEAVESFVKNTNFDKFQKDLKTQYAVIKAIEIIGEATRSIPDGFRKKHSNIPSKKMTAMRDRLVHDYIGVDLPTVWDTATKNIPPLKKLLREII